MSDSNTRIMIKRQFIRLTALLLALVFPWTALAEVVPLAFRQDSTSRDGLVRVLLSSFGNLQSMTLNLRGSYTVNTDQETLSAGTQVIVSCNTTTGQLTLSASGSSWNMGDMFTLNRSTTQANATIAQASKNNPYPADFLFSSTQKNGSYCLLPVAYIQIEDYLCGVLPYELGNHAHLEALKAQAVAARTYTIRMMENRAGNQYDVVDTSADQLYCGTPSGNENCKAAVQATQGVVLKYGNRYAETYYSSSNGGQTESALNIWGGKGYDYLTVKDDPYDAANGSAKAKTATIYRNLSTGSNRQALLTLLKQKAVSVLTQKGYAASMNNTSLIWLEKLTLHTPKYAAPSKLYTKADFQLTVETVASGGGSHTTSVTVTADVFRDLEGILGMSLTSSTNEIWTSMESDTAYTLKAGRYGHGVGMSQYGAMEMARQGYTYDAILGFYYPGCVNVKLNLTDEPMNESGNTFVPETPDEGGEAGDSDVPADSPAASVGYATVIANGFVNLRAHPSLSADILGTAPEGKVVTVISLESDWAFVEYQGICAYAVRSLLSQVFQEDDSESNAPGFSDTPEAQPDVPGYSSDQRMIFCLNGFVNFREAPDRNARILMQLPHGTILESKGTNGDFTHVVYQGIQGYVMTSYLVSASVMNPQQPTATAQPQPTPSPEETTVPEKTPTPSVPDDDFQPATVTTVRGSLNLRLQPSENARILAQIPQYSQVEAGPAQAGWCRVRYAGMEGYVMSVFLTFSTQELSPTVEPENNGSLSSDPTGQAQVNTKAGSLNLRMSPEPYAAILTTIPKGRIVEVYSNKDGWAMVAYQGYVGYVMTAYLSMLHTDDSAFEAMPLPTETVPVQIPVGNAPQSSQATAPMPDLPAGYTAAGNLYAVARAGDAYLRLSPSMNDRILQTIAAGEQIAVLAVSDQWCIAQQNGITGYLYLDEVMICDPDTEKSKEL